MDFDLGYAENTGDFLDPNSWKILNKDENPQIHAWPNPDVIKVCNKYYAYTEVSLKEHGFEWISRGERKEPWLICEAVSDDGIRWKVLGWIRPRKDAHHYQVPEAFFMEEKGEKWIYLFYSIPVAGEPYDFRNRRICYMRRRVSEKELGMSISGK